MPEKPQQPVSRRRHFGYVLLFLVVIWFCLGFIVGEFFPDYDAVGGCGCGYHPVYANTSPLFYGLLGSLWGIVLAYPLHRIISVKHSRPQDEKIAVSRIPRIGMNSCGLFGCSALIFLAVFHVIFSVIAFGGVMKKPWEVGKIHTPEEDVLCAIMLGKDEYVKSRLPRIDDLDKDVCAELMSEGDKLLNFAIYHDRREVFDLLLEYGADVNSVNVYGSTPLHAATRKDSAYYLETLLSRGADPNVINDFARTPLDLINRKNKEKMIAVLRAHGAKTGEELRAEREKK